MSGRLKLADIAQRKKRGKGSQAYAAWQEIQKMLRAQLIVAVLAGGLLPSRALMTNASMKTRNLRR
jgi:hypothetical protein